LGDEWLLIRVCCEVTPMTSSNSSTAGQTSSLTLLAVGLMFGRGGISAALSGLLVIFLARTKKV